ncbi:MAG: thioredoxin fold domain-containing protein [Halioglobus sp.]|nr:thioredoxin fold domain-containing protein [Halioglobus sp.]
MNFRMVHLLCVTVLLAMGAVHGVAGEGDKAGTGSAQIEKVRGALERPDLGLAVESVEPSDIPGLYTVQFANGPVVYATANGSHFIIGDLHEVTADGFVNVTEKRRDGERVKLIAGVDDKDMIVFSPEGETRAHVNVFTDVTCFYCQKLHREVAQLNAMGIEVRYLAYPRAGPGSDGYNKLVTAWCAGDRQDALTRLKAKQSVPQQSCEDNPVDEQFSLGRQVGVSGTPAMVTSDGQLIPGYQPADQLAATLGVK